MERGVLIGMLAVRGGAVLPHFEIVRKVSFVEISVGVDEARRKR